MAKNTGKPSERLWLDAWALKGKAAWTHRFVDAAEIRGKTGKVAVGASSQPSDFLLVYNGETVFCEVKSTQNVASFPFSLLNTNQSAEARMILAAGGSYKVFVHAMITNRWYCVPYDLITLTRAAGRSSIKWADLDACEWKI